MNMYVCMCMEICPNKKLGFGVIQILGAVFIGTPHISTHARTFVHAPYARMCRHARVTYK